MSLPRGGQFNCSSISSCTVRIRFDDGQSQAFSAIGPDDNSSDTVFIQNAARLMTALKSAKVTRIEAGYFQNGNQVSTFPTAGFDSGRMGAAPAKNK